MGLATAIETSIDTLLDTFVTAKSAALCSALVPVALTGVTIYVILMGWAIMRGEAHDPLHTALWKLFKIALIGGIALSSGEYQATAIDAITGIQGTFVSAFGNANTIGGLIDNMGEPYAALASAYIDQGLLPTIPDLSLFLAGVLVIIGQAVLFIVGLGMYLLAKVGLALVLAVGPAFILCAMFPATQRFTEGWVGQALSFVLLAVFVAAVISMLTSFATQTAAKALQNVSASNQLKDATGLLVVSITLVVVALKGLPTLASALSGGASISGIGRDVARALGRMVGGNGSEDGTAAAGGTLQQGSLRSAGTSSSSFLYQRNVLNQLHNDA